ncbi:MAG TPA: hypothetical protein DDW49_08065 [Deltaproteobacteria bacterium]|nr:hypothetical protein [Deltaproteobacteria bacterium]
MDGLVSRDLNYYTLSLRANINGGLLANQVNGGVHTLPGLQAWMGDENGPHNHPNGYSSSNFVARSDAGGNWHTGRDPVLSGAGGWIVGNSATSFNRNNFHLESDIINIRDYYPLNDPNAQNLYTFSNLVHITQWNTEFRYPNGDEVTAFERGTMNIFSDGTLNIRGDNLEDVNSNYNDNFTFRMTPDGIPRRFLEIRGSAQANYSLRYYDASRLEWIAIPSATQNEVVNGILAWWDVTYLNGRNITVLLRSEQNGEINEDTIDVSIGRPVAPGQRVEVSTPFERATLDFDPNTLPAGTNEQLVTMSLVDPSDPSIHLPSGAVPLGPILDIKPDDIEIDPNHPVELTLRFTCEEINELFGNDPAEVSLYNIRDNGELEVIASLNAPDPTICENAPADRLFEIVGFLNHFSRYAVFKRGTTPSVIHLETPVEDQFYKGSVPVSGSIEGDRLSSWRVSYTPAVDEDDALPANPTIINQGNTQDFNFQWNTEGLNGSFTLLVEAIDNNGQTSTYQRVVKIDNIAPLTIPFLNELELINGERALADLNDVLELSAIDSGDEASGVQSLVYQVNGGAFVNYEGAIALNILGLGNHRISFRATDRIGNEEALKTIVLAVAEEIEPEEPAVIQTQISVGQPSITRNGQIWVSERTPITIQAAQGENSISSILYSFGDGDFRPYNGAFTLAGLPEGIYEIEYYAADFFGNNEPIRRQTVILDNVRPVTTVRTGGVAQNVNGGLLVRSHQTLFTLTGEDLGNHPSGIRYIQYRIGQGIWLRYNNPFRISRPQGANQTSLALRAIDHVGNVESAHVLNILFDANAPQAQVVSLPQAFSPNGDGVKDTAVFTLNADDDLAEELILDLRIGNSFILQNHPVQRGPIEVAWNGRINGQLQRNGEYAYTINVRDAEGNVSNAVGGVVILDVTSPMLQVANAGAIRFIPDRQGRGTINIPYDVSDNLFNKGLQTKLRIFAGNLVLREIVEEISSPPNQHSIAWDGNNSQGLPVPEGDYEWALSATDPAGNESAIVRFPVHVDISSPEIGYEITDPKYITPERVWIHGNSRISLFANDIHSNIQFVHYRVDQLPWQMYQAPFGFNEEGEHILEFGAIDESGNGSGIQRLSINVDLTAPQSRFVMNNFRRGFDNRIQVSSQTRLRLDASDAGSGVLSRRLSIDGSEVLLAGPDIDLVAIADGRHVIEYWSVDNVLNTERRHQVEVDANIHPPRSTLVVNGPQFRGDRFYISRNSQLTIEATATIPDIDYVRYTVDQNAAITVEGDRVDTLRTPIFRIANQGAHLIGHQSADVLGNMENLNKRAVFVDNTPPTTSLEFSNNAFGREGVRRIKDDTKITLRAVDEHVGIKTVFYRIDQGPEQIYDGPFMLNDEDGGNHTINYRSEDQLENIEMIKSEVVFLWHPSLRKEVLRESRSLWHIVECSEDNQEDEHPYRDLLEDIMETKLGDTFYQFADDFEDWNRFMRSDIFNTFIFGMDNPQCEALRSPKLIRILSELKERVFNGDTVILLENPNHIPDWIWRNFIGRVFAQRALPVDPDQQWEVHPYGLGRGIVMDVTDENDGTVDEGRANDLGPLLEGIEDRDEELNSGEIFPVKIWVGSPFDAMAGDLLETSSTQGNFTEVKIHSHDRINQHDGELKWNYTVPSGEGRFLRYLYRVSEQGGPYQVISKINLRSEYGLKYVEQLDLNFEVKHSLQDLSRLVADDFQTLIQEEIDNQRRQQLGLLFNRFNAEMARNVANEADVNLRIDVILFLIDRLRGMDLEDDPIHYDLAELLIVVEATGIPQPEPPGNAFVQRNDDDENERAIQLNNDTDRDGLDDATERAHALDPLDADSDDDGVKDGEEVQPLVDTDNDGAINALDPDSDNDGLVDGTETGIIEPVEAFDGDRVQNLPAFEGTQEDSPSFVPDEDPASRTNPVIADTDGGGVSDGAEDSNHNGRVDPAERNPNDPDDDQRRVIIRVQEMP